MVHHAIHEIAVVAHDDEAPAEGAEVFLQNLQGGDVEVIGGFVQHQKVRTLHQYQT